MVRALTAHATMALGLLGWWGCAHPKPVGNEVFVGVVRTVPPGMSARFMATCDRHLDAATWDRWRAAGVPSRTLDRHLIEQGKKPKVALVACMRKLLIHLNALMRAHLDGLDLAAAA